MSKKRPAGRPWQVMCPAEPIGHLRPDIKAMLPPEDEPKEMWQNDLYTVIVFHREAGITELSIRRNDREYPRDWRHFQRIKNDICGPEREAVELYPAESRLVDGANQFHLWVLPEGKCFDFGYFGGRSVGDDNHPLWEELRLKGALGKQRPLDQS